MKIEPKLLAAIISMVLVTATFSTIATGFDEQHETEIVLVSLEGEDDVNRIESIGGEILHRYPNRVLVEIPEGTEGELRSAGIDIRSTLSRRTEISVAGYQFDINEGEPDLPEETTIDGYQEGEEGQYIVHMLGPVAPEWRSEIEDKGVEVMNYIHNYAYRVRMTPEQAERVSDLDFIDWIGIYHPEYKLQPGLEPGTVNIRLAEGAERDSLDEVVETAPVISSAELQGRGFKITAEVDSQETLYELARITDVTYISEYVEVELHDEMATQIIGGGTWFYPEDWEPGDNAYRNPDLPGEYAGDAGSYMNQVGYTGEDVVVAVADTGLGDGTTPDAGHDDFTGRVIGGYTFGSGGWEDGHGHGTHCAGSVAGDTYHGTGQGYGFDDYYAAQGSAPEALLFAVQIFENGGSVIPADLMEIFEVAKQEADEPAYVHSNSWGSTGGHGTYTEQSAVFDAAVRDSNRDTDYNEPMVITGSAGNDGDTGVPPPASAKNIITVGATENYNSETDNPEYIASFSSRGPVDDNRIKPDVQAPGSDVYSTEPGNSYQYMSGTSMSNPAVAGAAAVVVEWYEEEYGEKPSPAMVKSILINTANPLDGDTEGPIPNGDEGWGMVDISKLQRPHDDPVSFLLEDQNSLLETGDIDEHTVGVENPDEPLKISLTWTDQEAPDDTGSGTALMNDLNLEVISPGGDVYHGNAFAEDAGDQSTWDYTYANTDTMSLFDDSGDGWDDTNNVQNVYIHPDELESGAYTINVEGYNVPEDANNDGTANQDYALTIYNAAEGPQIELERPEGGEYWEVGEEEEILWNTDEGAGEITHIDLDYSADGGTSWNVIEHDLVDDGSYLWTIPDDTSEEAVVRATVYDDQDDTEPGVDMSDEFTITDVTPPEVTLTSPIGGEEWHAGELEDITWDSEEGDEPIVGVDLAYSIDGGDSWEYIVQDEEDTGSYTWEIPDETTSEALVRVWVYCQEETTARDTSDDYFDLVGYPPEPPENLDVEYTSEAHVTAFYDDVTEDKGYDTWESHDHASEWGIRGHGAVVGDESWDWGDGEFNKDPDEGMESRLISPEIDIPEDPDEVELTFQHWRDFGDTSLYDGGNLRLSQDGGDFEIIEPEEGYDGTIAEGWGNPLGGEPGWGGTVDWEIATFDLIEEVGEDIGGSTIQLRWNAGTEAWDGFYGEGWRIDDIHVEAVVTDEDGEDDNFLTWDASPGDWGDDTDSSDVEVSTPDDATLEAAGYRSTSGVADSSISPEQEDEWRWLYEGEWRPDETDDGIGLTDEGLWWGAIRMDLSDDVGLSFTDVAYYDHEEAAHYAQGYVAPDDGDAPAEDWIPTEEYTPTGAGWVELELDEPVAVEDPGDYWIVMEFDDMGDGYFPFGCIEPEVDNGGLVNMDDPHDPGSWDNLGDFDLDYTWALEGRVIPMEVYFEVEIVDYDEEVEPGEEVLVDYTVTNQGNEEDTQTIEFYVEDDLEDSVTVTLGDGEVYDDTFTWQTDEEDLGYYDLLVASEDAEDEVTVMVGDTKPVSYYTIYRAEDEDGPWDEPIAEIEADGSDSYEYLDYDQAGEPYNWYVVRAVSDEGVEEQNEIAVPEPGVDQEEYTLNVDSTEGGEVVEPGEDEYTYNAGEEVNLEAVADENYAFIEWTGDIENIENPTASDTTITMEGDYSITANFDETEVDEVLIYPETDQVVDAGEELEFDAEAYDTDGNLITDHPEDFDWQNAEIGVFYETETGDYDVTATYDGVTSEPTTVTVEPAEAEEIEISPQTAEIVAGGSQEYTATAIDEWGNEFEVTGETDWSDDIDDSEWLDNEVTAYSAGDWTVTGEYENDEGTLLTDTGALTVEPGEVDDVVIYPEEDQVVQAGEELQFDAEAYDAYGNLITDNVDDFEWENADQGLFYETEAGDYDVTATYDGMTSPITTVTVEPVEVDEVEITPSEDQEIEAGETLTFEAAAYDEEGDLITDDRMDFEWESATRGVFNRRRAGEYEVTATYDGETSPTTTVTVEPAEAARIEISPEEETVGAGTTMTYTAIAYDEYENEIGDVSGDTTWSIEEEAGGSWTENEYTSEVAGEYWTVEGDYEGLTDNALLTVEPGQVDTVELDPSEDQTITSGEKLEFSAVAYDSYGNLIADNVEAFEWQNAIRGVFYYDTPGEYEVTATYEGETSEPVTVTVEEEETEDTGGLESSSVNSLESDTLIAEDRKISAEDTKEFEN